ncbi:MAG: NfeD family protein [Pseudomonadota bacterium]
MDVFDFLNGLSPWWWIAAALALGTIEILTFSFFLIWPAIAAFLVGILLWLFPEMSGAMQILIFAVLSAILTLVGRQWVMTRKPTSDNPGLNNRASALIGRNATLIEDLSGTALGNVEVDGIRWRARLDTEDGTAATGASLQIATADGMVLVLKTPA